MLRRMRVRMLLADAASMPDGNLHILGGGWNITGRRAWRDQACAERLAQAHGKASPRWEGP
jgi:hypothetical protein